MAAVLPRNLALIVQRLANFNRTTIRVRPQSNDTAAAGQTISFRLPTNTLVDLHNLQLSGVVRAIIRADSSATPPVQRWHRAGLPVRMNQIFERIDVVVNGQVITGNNTDYAGLDHLLSEHTYATGRSAGRFLESGRGLLIRRAATSTEDLSFAFQTTSSTDPGLEEPFLVNKFTGFLGGDYVRFIDTAVLGPVELRFRLATPAILSVPTTPGVATFSYVPGTSDFVCSNMHLIMDTVSFADDFYRAILAKRLMEGGIIQIPYTNYFSVQKSVGAASNEFLTFNISTQSLDYLIASLRKGDYNNGNLKPYDDQGAAEGSGLASTRNAAYLSFYSGGGPSATTYQFMINNQLAPTWPASVPEAYALTRAAFDQIHTKDAIGAIDGLTKYTRGSFAFAQCFKHHAGYNSPDTIISGLDTRGASSNMALILNGTRLTVGEGAVVSDLPPADIPWNVIVWACCTSTLEVSAGQNVVTIF